MIGSIQDFFREHNKAAVAFSGGVDSSFLLYAAHEAGADVKAYYVKSAFQPDFEFNDALRIAKELKVPFSVLSVDVLKDPQVAENPANRCYYCKKHIFKTIQKAAKTDGYELILDGTNASDDPSDRPGVKALQEMGVLSPLRDCGYTKEMIRKLSKEAGLFTWKKPAYACLATRIRTGEEITQEKLSIVEECENFLFRLGMEDIRVRISDKTARIQVPEEAFAVVVDKKNEILQEFEKFFSTIVLDLKSR